LLLCGRSTTLLKSTRREEQIYMALSAQRRIVACTALDARAIMPHLPGVRSGMNAKEGPPRRGSARDAQGIAVREGSVV
jgi:hypothetical protein